MRPRGDVKRDGVYRLRWSENAYFSGTSVTALDAKNSGFTFGSGLKWNKKRWMALSLQHTDAAPSWLLKRGFQATEGTPTSRLIVQDQHPPDPAWLPGTQLKSLAQYLIRRAEDLDSARTTVRSTDCAKVLIWLGASKESEAFEIAAV